jgi:hypothetical protein
MVKLKVQVPVAAQDSQNAGLEGGKTQRKGKLDKGTHKAVEVCT